MAKTKTMVITICEMRCNGGLRYVTEEGIRGFNYLETPLIHRIFEELEEDGEQGLRAVITLTYRTPRQRAGDKRLHNSWIITDIDW